MDCCVFCDIILRKKSGRIIFENDTTMAFFAK